MKTVEQLGISPAPWTADMETSSSCVYDNLGVLVCIEEHSDLTSDRELDWRNARLIAAAPELYEALRGLLEIVCGDCNSAYKVDGKCVKCPRVVAAEAALVKAGGAQ